jgi:hypothetical protein
MLDTGFSMLDIISSWHEAHGSRFKIRYTPYLNPKSAIPNPKSKDSQHATEKSGMHNDKRPKPENREEASKPQRILVFQQNSSGEAKVAGLRKYGGESLALESISIDQALPTVIDDTAGYIPENFQADLVLDFLKHPDLSHDLARICTRRNIPIIASGKKPSVEGALTPPT